MNELELTGRARSHIIELSEPRCGLHYEAVAAFLAMSDAAASAGIDLKPVSSFRDFDTQVAIWNRKWASERPLYDRVGRLLDRRELSEAQLVEAILCWSAIPGGSRHHWGTDVDVIDAASVPPGYAVQLVYRPSTPRMRSSRACRPGWTGTCSASASSVRIAPIAAASVRSHGT